MTAKIVSFGEAMIGFYPMIDSELDNSYLKTWGGDTSNVALAAAKLGCDAACLTAVGRDEFGESFLQLWQEAGVDISQVKIDQEHPTALYFVSYLKDAHKFAYYRRDSAAANITPGDINRDRLKGVRLLHLSGISQGISESALETSLELMHFAKKNNILISYDINYRPPLWNKDIFKAVMAYTIKEFVDILEINDQEMQVLGLGENIEDLVGTIPRIPQLLAVKAGEKGCSLYQDGRICKAESFSVEVRDTVGAGDALDAGLITAYLEGLRGRELALYANAVAACTCMQTGPLLGQPSRSELKKFFKENI